MARIRVSPWLNTLLFIHLELPSNFKLLYDWRRSAFYGLTGHVICTLAVAIAQIYGS